MSRCDIEKDLFSNKLKEFLQSKNSLNHTNAIYYLLKHSSVAHIRSEIDNLIEISLEVIQDKSVTSSKLLESYFRIITQCLKFKIQLSGDSDHEKFSKTITIMVNGLKTINSNLRMTISKW